jgi:hypothetical protein
MPRFKFPSKINGSEVGSPNPYKVLDNIRTELVLKYPIEKSLRAIILESKDPIIFYSDEEIRKHLSEAITDDIPLDQIIDMSKLKAIWEIQKADNALMLEKALKGVDDKADAIISEISTRIADETKAKS